MAEQERNRRKVPMEVLSLGFSRTGTSSMQKALQILGIPCHHAFELYDHVDQCAAWNRAFDAKFSGKGQPFDRADWDSLLGDYGAVTDVPSIAFAEDLVSIYPEAKVLLVERDIDRWYASFDKNVIRHMYDFAGNLVARLDRWFLGPPIGVHHRWARGWMGVNSEAEMQAAARTFYHEHYARVREVTPPERLLEYELGSGWEPLCEFLGKPVPDVPFPRVNESAAMDEKIKGVIRKGIGSIAWNLSFYALPAVGAVAAAWWYTAEAS